MKKVFFLTALASTIILMAFTFTSNDQKVIVIDVGHGGKDPGAHVENTLEKEVNLKIAEKILALNANENINLLISRKGDKFMSVEDRVTFAKKNNADLFISIHTNFKNDSNIKGVELYHSAKNNSRRLAEQFKLHLSKTHMINSVQKARFRVLNEIDCPGVMIESGYLSNETDRKRLTSEEGQIALAKAILKGLQ